MTNNTITTIEGLAALINETMASKEDIKDVREDIATVNGRLDRIEHLLIEEFLTDWNYPHAEGTRPSR